MATAAARYVLRLKDGLLSFLRGTDLPVALEPQLAVRGAASSEDSNIIEFSKNFSTSTGDINARLTVEAGMPGLDVEVAVTREGSLVEGMRVKLIKHGRPVDSVPVDEGHCQFRNLEADRYEFELRKGGIEVGRMVLDVRL
jgi:hypothetical protein